MTAAPLFFAGNAVAGAVHLHARAVLQEPRGFFARGHLRAVDAAIAAMTEGVGIVALDRERDGVLPASPDRAATRRL
jgi:hypothetical protein